MPGTGGYSTNSFPIATMAQIPAGGLISVDTQNANGSSPQTIAAPIGLLINLDQVATGLTAHSGGSQTNALLVGYGTSNVTVVAAGNDSIKLPVAILGAKCWLMNSDASDSMQVFGSGIDTINSVATATGVAHAAGKAFTYVCVVASTSTTAGNWVRSS